MYITVQSPNQSIACFSRRALGGKSCSQFPPSLFLVQCKCTSMGLDVYLTPRFNPKRSGNRSMNALVVADGNVLDCPHCQARGPGPGGSADIIVSLWVLPGAADRESCAGSNPFLPKLPQSPLCHCFCSPSYHSLQKKLLRACLGSDISLPKEIHFIGSWGRR